MHLKPAMIEVARAAATVGLTIVTAVKAAIPTVTDGLMIVIEVTAIEASSCAFPVVRTEAAKAAVATHERVAKVKVPTKVKAPSEKVIGYALPRVASIQRPRC